MQLWSHSNQERTSYKAQWYASVYHESCRTGQSFSPELYAHHAVDWEISFPPNHLRMSRYPRNSRHNIWW